MSSLSPATIITTTASLVQHTEQWSQETLLAIDTESNGLYAYQEQVCLIQLSTRDADYIIDPLQVEDLSVLGTLFAAPEIEIIFHAAEFDVGTMKRDFGFEIVNLFDTMHAARICGKTKFGLANLLAEHFGVKANKKYQRANWGERPIPPEMMRYAQLDTHYLPALRDYWREKLIEQGHWEEAQEFFKEVCRTPATNNDFNPDAFWNIHGVNHLSRRQHAILKELYLFREDAARKRDVPPFKVIGDKSLVKIAEHAPHHISDLRRIDRLPPSIIRRYGWAFVDAVKKGENSPTPQRPPMPPRPSDDVYARFEALRSWRKHRAEKRGVDSDIILSKEALWALARKVPTSVRDLDDIKQIGPWRQETYGQEIIDLLSK